MDIKDWILIGGGLLLVAVVGHGFLLAWRNSRRDKLLMDIDPNIPKTPISDQDLFRGELPNGGARVRKIEPLSEPEQSALDLEESSDVEVIEEPPRAVRRAKPIVPERRPAATRPTKATPIVPERGSLRDRLKSAALAPVVDEVEDEHAENLAFHGEPEIGTAPDPEVIVIRVLARNETMINGTDLLNVLLRNGLKFGDMNIFHRVKPASKEVQFSVASAVKPGTFDLSKMDEFHTPGVSFFMQMPGPEHPLDAFEDMVAVARDVAASLEADLKDEQLCAFTGQTNQHCKSRIEDFSRKRMSSRA